MSDDNSFNISRRQALAAMGASGAAVGLGGLGTYAQFTDTEEETVTFTAGGIDGRVRGGARYNGQVIQDFGSGFQPQVDLPGVEGFEEAGALGLGFELTDVKPGDHGCFSFGIEVTNNPAWVAACIGFKNNHDALNFEPEIDPDSNVTSANVGADGELLGGESLSEEDGELAQNLLVLPFYKPPNDEPSGEFNPCKFFDEDQQEYVADTEISDFVSTPTQFWSNSENNLLPRTLAEAATFQMIDTENWGDDDYPSSYVLDDTIAVDPGCVFLNGAADEGDQNQQDAHALQPGTELWMGWDFHLPFDTGNIVQGDSLDLQLGFVFGQTRHTESAQLSNVFAPQENLPGD